MSQLHANRASAALAPSNGSDSGAAADDPRVVEALEEYATALKQGRRQGRAEFLAKHADVAEALAECLDGLEMVHGAAGELVSQAANTSTTPPQEMVTGTLGDYRILREIGRGGMGVVFEAEQISLGRRVALKVLPFAATMDKRQLQRFQNEARAAASLEHPHIVPVYGIGCERGVHYYAMRFIEGQPLDSILQQLRDEKQPAAPTPPSAPDPAAGATVAQSNGGPVAAADSRSVTETVREPRGQASTLLSHGSKKELFRRIAELARQAADALEHAHQTGVVHRDIKPANLLMDHESHLWITDFGLAQIQSDTRLTMTGDLVGTLRYMSPEQALAKRVIVDHRTDIYSLGATFYEVLTLTPVFGGQDRQELLRQIAFEEPVTPRRLNRHIPAELETVILKALEKNPTERYGTAKELADDLSRFLNEEPTLARRPTLWQRGQKWSRRHVAAVRAAAAAMFVVVAVVAGTAGWWLNDRANRQAETARSVGALLQEAEFLQKARRMPEALAKVKQASEILVSGASTPALKLGVKDRLTDMQFVADLEEIRFRIADDRKDGNFDFSSLNQAYAQAFRAFGIDLEALAMDDAVRRITGRTVPSEIALALDEWASSAKRSAASPFKDFWKQLLAVARAVDPDPWRCKLRDARTEDNVDMVLSMVHADNLPAPTAVALAFQLGKFKRNEEAVKVLRTARHRDPDDFWINYALGEALHELNPAELEESMRFFTAATAIRRNSAAAHNMLGLALSRTGRLQEATAEYREAIRLLPDYPLPHSNLGALYCDKLKDYDSAISCFREAIRLKPDHPIFHTNLSAALRNKGLLAQAMAACEVALGLDPKCAPGHSELGKVHSAKGDLDKAIAAYEEATRLDPDFAWPHFYLGKAHDAKRQWDAAIAAYRAAIKIKTDWAEAHNNLGSALMEIGQIGEAFKSFKQAIHYNSKLWQPHRGLGRLYLKKGMVDEAIAEFEAAAALQPDSWSLQNDIGAIYLEKKKRADVAITHFNKAIKLQPDYANAHYNLGNAHLANLNWDDASKSYLLAIKYRPDYAEAHSNLGNIYAQTGKTEEAITAYQKAINDKPSLWQPYNGLAPLLQKRGLANEAIAAYRKAIKLNPNLATAQYELGNLLAAQGQYKEAIGFFESSIQANRNFAIAHKSLGFAQAALGRHADAIAALRQAVMLQPNMSDAQNDLAWWLAVAHDSNIRDAKAAVTHALNAVELEPNVFGYRNTLGVGRYRNGEWKEAVEALNKSITLAKGGDSVAFFFMSMSHFRLGDKDQAKIWYDKGVQWMDKNNPNDAELRRFHTEAAELLGIEAAKEKAKKGT